MLLLMSRQNHLRQRREIFLAKRVLRTVKFTFCRIFSDYLKAAFLVHVVFPIINQSLWCVKNACPTTVYGPTSPWFSGWKKVRVTMVNDILLSNEQQVSCKLIYSKISIIPTSSEAANLFDLSTHLNYEDILILSEYKWYSVQWFE